MNPDNRRAESAECSAVKFEIEAMFPFFHFRLLSLGICICRV